jgi:hypothetical protein
VSGGRLGASPHPIYNGRQVGIVGGDVGLTVPTDNSRVFRVIAPRFPAFTGPRHPRPQKILGRQRCDHTLGLA